jgi:hypothetical protein
LKIVAADALKRTPFYSRHVLAFTFALLRPVRLSGLFRAGVITE